MQLTKIKSSNITDKIVKSMSGTEDESLYEEYGAVNQNRHSDSREENEELYEEYMYEGDYEEYRFRYQEYDQKRKAVNTKNAPLIDETLFQKFLKRKWWLFGLILVLVTAAIVIGLFIHFKKTRATPSPALAVLMLSTRESSNVPMVIASNGEFHFEFS